MGKKGKGTFEIEHDGKHVTVEYEVKGAAPGITVTVRDYPGKRFTQLGGMEPEQLALMLAREILRYG